MVERTLAIIKPDATQKKLIGKIIERIEEEGFNIVQMRLVHLSREEAGKFYEVHKNKSFYESLINFMSSGPAVVMLLEGDDVIAGWRSVMGATDPALAKPGTIRHQYGSSVERNAVHGSDSPENAVIEISFFFKS